jgi:hypothetical protein
MQEFADHIAELNRQIAERIWAIGCANNLDLGKSAVAAREDAERCHLVPGPAPATGRPAHRGCEGVAGVNPPRDRDSSGAGVFIPAREIEKFGGSGIRRACGPGKPGGATRTPRLPACCENPVGADLRRGSHQGRSTVGSVARSQVATEGGGAGARLQIADAAPGMGRETFRVLGRVSLTELPAPAVVAAWGPPSSAPRCPVLPPNVSTTSPHR